MPPASTHEIVGGDRQGGEPRARREREPHQAVDGDERHVVDQEKALAQRQEQQLRVHRVEAVEETR